MLCSDHVKSSTQRWHAQQSLSTCTLTISNSENLNEWSFASSPFGQRCVWNHSQSPSILIWAGWIGTVPQSTGDTGDRTHQALYGLVYFWNSCSGTRLLIALAALSSPITLEAFRHCSETADLILHPLPGPTASPDISAHVSCPGLQYYTALHYLLATARSTRRGAPWRFGYGGQMELQATC